MGIATKYADLAVRAPSSRSYTQRVSLPPVVQLLTSGGDARIARDPTYGANKFGCSPTPDPTLLAYGSSTASVITQRGFAAAERLRLRLIRATRVEAPNITYAREIDRIRADLLTLCNLSDVSDVEVIFAPSGTDIHLIASQLACRDKTSSLLAVMIEATETGSGVSAALAGRHFSEYTALGRVVTPGVDVDIGSDDSIEVVAVASRMADGAPRPAMLIDAEVESVAACAALAGRRVLINLVDVSKTGIIAPSLACALELRRRFPDLVDVLVDACQFRLAPSTLRAYLERGFWIALTGSKFIGGPAFSGALIVPGTSARQLRTRPLTRGLRAYSARTDWPPGWTTREVLTDVENYGLLLRWEAALAELRSFCYLPEAAISGFLNTFAATVRQRLSNDSIFRPLPVPALDRRPLVNANSWDHIPTIFPFILCHPPNSRRYGAPLNREETAKVYSQLGKDATGLPNINLFDTRKTVIRRCQLGQPVHCGVINKIPVSALRLCVSMRLVVDAVSPQGRGTKTVVTEALLALDKAASLASAIGVCTET